MQNFIPISDTAIDHNIFVTGTCGEKLPMWSMFRKNTNTLKFSNQLAKMVHFMWIKIEPKYGLWRKMTNMRGMLQMT